MEKNLKLLFIAFSVIMLFIILLAISFIFIYNRNDLLEGAKRAYPLGKRQIYIIQVNSEVKNERDEILLPDGIFYTFILPGEKDQMPLLSGRQISTSKVELEPYLNQEVYINGSFSESYPLLINRTNVPDYFINAKRVTLDIDSIEFAN